MTGPPRAIGFETWRRPHCGRITAGGPAHSSARGRYAASSRRPTLRTRHRHRRRDGIWHNPSAGRRAPTRHTPTDLHRCCGARFTAPAMQAKPLRALVPGERLAAASGQWSTPVETIRQPEEYERLATAARRSRTQRGPTRQRGGLADATPPPRPHPQCRHASCRHASSTAARRVPRRSVRQRRGGPRATAVRQPPVQAAPACDFPRCRHVRSTAARRVPPRSVPRGWRGAGPRPRCGHRFLKTGGGATVMRTAGATGGRASRRRHVRPAATRRPRKLPPQSSLSHKAETQTGRHGHAWTGCVLEIGRAHV